MITFSGRVFFVMWDKVFLLCVEVGFRKRFHMETRLLKKCEVSTKEEMDCDSGSV